MACCFASICLQDLCKELHHKIDVIDEERYDLGSKVDKSSKEVQFRPHTRPERVNKQHS